MDREENSNQSVGTYEQELIEKIRRGDREEFEYFVKKYQVEVFALIMRQVGSYDLASDLSQQVFLNAFGALGKFRAQASFRTWLTKITLNCLSSYWKSRQYREVKMQVELKKEIALESSQQEEALQIEKNLQKLRQAIAKLKDKYREVIILCAIEEKSYAEVSMILDVPIGTVSSRMYKAMRMLQRSLSSLKT